MSNKVEKEKKKKRDISGEAAKEAEEAKKEATSDGEKVDDITSEPEPEDIETSRDEDKGDPEKSKDVAETKQSKASEEDESWSEKYTRLMADFQNYKKRTEKEKSDVYAFANEKIMTDLLEVTDNFERALGNECADEAYQGGMEMIFKQLTDIMSSAGLEEIKAEGEDFDPNFHHAVMQDSNKDFDSGKVTEVLQKGYTLNGKVVRPAMVKVNE